MLLGRDASSLTTSAVTSQASSAFCGFPSSSVTSSPTSKLGFQGAKQAEFALPVDKTTGQFSHHSDLLRHNRNIFNSLGNFTDKGSTSGNPQSFGRQPLATPNWPQLASVAEDVGIVKGRGDQSSLLNQTLAASSSGNSTFVSAASINGRKFNSTTSDQLSKHQKGLQRTNLSASGASLTNTMASATGGGNVFTSYSGGGVNVAPRFRVAEGGKDNDDNNDCFATSDEFESMVGDLRRTFIGWLKRTEAELRREKDRVKQSKKDLETERGKCLKEIEKQKEVEFDRIKEERQHFRQECSHATKQITTEREDSRRKINEEKSKFEHEKELQRRKILMEREKFREEHELFEAERRRIVDGAIATETAVQLNVGGVTFQSARHTLTQQSGSFLEAMFSGRHKMNRDKNGCIFIDRDSEVFRTILNFLRNPSLPPTPKDVTDSENLCKEAKFYGLHFYPFPLVFACGGHNGVEHLRAVELLDVGLQCWRPCKPMETERTHFGGAVVNGRLQVFGGQNLDYKALCDVEVYDILRDCWFPGPPLGIARRNLIGVEFADRIYAIGGFDGTSILPSVEAYDPRMKSWMEVAPMTVARSSAMTVVHGDALFVLGGTKGERLRTVETYDVKMNKWIPFEADMIEVRSAGCAASVCGELLSFGGTDSAHRIHSSLETYDIDSQRWTFRKSMREPRMDAACTVVSDSVLVSGGQHGEVVSSTEFYRPALDEWQHGPNMLFPRYGHTLVLANI